MRKLSVAQAARSMNVHPQTIRFWVRNGILPDRRFPGTRKMWFYPEDVAPRMTSQSDLRVA